MALASYSDLKTALAAHLNRSDLTSYLDDFIDIAEARHQREIRLREMLTRASIAVDNRQIAVPSGVLEIISFRLLTEPVTVLEEVNLHEMNRLRKEITGCPWKFTIHEEIEFDVEPDTSYGGEIVYYEALTALSDANTSNSLLAKAPDVYLYSALVAASPFLGADERIPTWDAFYRAGRDALNLRASSSRRVGPLVPRIAGAIR